MFSKVLIAGCLIAIWFSGEAVAQTSNNFVLGSDSLKSRSVQENTDANQLPPDRIEIRTSGSPEAELVGEIRANLVANIAKTEAVIFVEVVLPPGCHIYSLTQNDPRQTRIDISQSPHASVHGPAQPSRKPDPVSADSVDSADAYSDRVAFIVPLQLNNLPKPADLNMLVRLNGMICSDKGFCVPIQDRVVRTTLLESVESLPVNIRSTSDRATSHDWNIDGGRK